MHTTADRLTLLDALYGVRVTLAPDGRYLDVAGPSASVDAAMPLLMHRKQEFLAYLRARSHAPARPHPHDPEQP